MPRDGSNVYTQPFPDVVEGTTIESAVYNGYVADVTIDLNTPRPISAGGTGADNAADAMNNLGGEGSKIQVTNYDSHNFTAGSFYSTSSATAPPVAGHAFAGWCYPAVVAGVATTDLFIEARDRDDLTQPGALYARQRKAGVWSGWMKAAGVNSGSVAPDPATDNSLWWDPTQGKLFIRYNDGNTVQWVEAVAVPDLGPDDFVSVDVDQAFTETEKKTARSNIYAAPFDALAYNGMQINGSTEVSQERGINSNTGGFQGGARYICDGWNAAMNLGVASGYGYQVTGGGQPPPPPGYTSYIQIVPSSAIAPMGSTEFLLITQAIEGYRLSRLGWGVTNANPLTIAFWMKVHTPGTYSVSVVQAGGARSYVVPYTMNAADVWEFKTVTVTAPPTDGSWVTGNTAAATIVFTLASGTSNTAPVANQWTAASMYSAPGSKNTVTATDYLNLTGVVVLPGIEVPSAARSPLIMRPFDQELIICQRYWEKTYNYAAAFGTVTYAGSLGMRASGSIHTMTPQFRVSKRATPSIIVRSPGTGNGGFGQDASLGSDIVATLQDIGENSFQVYFPGVDGQMINFHFTADARI